MKIELTKKQYLNLLKMSHVASGVFGILGDFLPKETGYKKESNEIEDLENYLITYAEDFGCSDLVEDFRGKTLMKEDFYEEVEEVIDEYNDFTFWSELEVRMGKRDFARTKTEDDKKYIEENNGMLPERIHEIYDKYYEEFK